MVVVVMGLPGSGKTYFARQLALKVNATHISSDIVRINLEYQGRYDENSKLIVYDVMLQLMEEVIKRKENVVLDATFYKEQIRRRFEVKAKQFNTPIYFIEIKATEAVIKERISKDRPDSEADFHVYLKVKDCFDPVLVEHLTLHSDQQNLSEMLNQALTFINHDNARRGN
jgi:predicted kinase